MLAAVTPWLCCYRLDGDRTALPVCWPGCWRWPGSRWASAPGLLITIRSPRWHTRRRSLVPIGAAPGVMVPGSTGALLGAAVAAWSLTLMIPAPGTRRRLFTAAAVVWRRCVAVRQPPLLSIGCGLIQAALLVTIQALARTVGAVRHR